MDIIGVTERFTFSAVTTAKWLSIATIGAIAITISATLSGDDYQSANVMRLQLQEGINNHYWSVPLASGGNGVTRKQVQMDLNAMWGALQLLSALDWDNNSRWDKFKRFGQWEQQLWSATIRMSAWVGTHGPTAEGYYTVHQEYGDPTDETSPRIDLENIRGVNLRQ